MSKKYEELEFTDGFLFAKIMYTKPDLCKELLEMILDKEIDKIKFPEYEKTIEMLPDARGIRLDVYTKDEGGKVYDMEMQVRSESDIARRSRYYHSVIDLNLLERGEKYSQLNDVYVIFICKNRPEEELTRPVYTFRYQSQEDPETYLKDGTWTVFLNADCETAGLSPKMGKLLRFIREGKAEENGSDLASRLQDAVWQARKNQRWRTEYMTLEDYGDVRFEEGKKAGLEEGKKAGLEEGKKAGLEEGKKAGLEEERKNTEAERKRAEAEQKRADDAERKNAELLAEIERLKGQQTD